jgi:hypothetical protein
VVLLLSNTTKDKANRERTEDIKVEEVEVTGTEIKEETIREILTMVIRTILIRGIKEELTPVTEEDQEHVSSFLPSPRPSRSLTNPHFSNLRFRSTRCER